MAGITFKYGIGACVAAVGTALLAACGSAPAATGRLVADTSQQGAARPIGWHVDKIIRGNSAQFTAVAATGWQGGWAFESRGSFRARPLAFQRVGSRWVRRSFPGLPGESVVAASGPFSNDVWVATSDHRVLWFGARGWHLSRRFPRAIGSIIQNGPDVWVFGSPYVPGAGLGTWRLNAGKWTRVKAADGLYGGSQMWSFPVKTTGLWAYGHRIVAHWDGSTWSRTSVATLLPRATALCDPHLTGIYAQSDTMVWAAGTGGCQDQGGPFVLLGYNGTTWRRLALVRSLGAPVAITPDGNGGVWIVVSTGSPPVTSIEHYVHGRLTTARLPIARGRLFLAGAATAANSFVTLAVGFERNPVTHVADAAVILRYGR